MKVLSKRDEQHRKLWLLWLQYRKNAGESRERFFDALKKVACDMIAVDAASFARLGSSDETIYEHLAGLMGVYRRVVGIAEGYRSGGAEVRALLAGICEVLNSRLREFDELVGEDNGNPVSREKHSIIEGALAFTARRIDDSGVNALQTDSLLEEAYAHYREGLRFCLVGLDDLHARKIAGLYTDLIEREWEELGNIIRVQVSALEQMSYGSVEMNIESQIETSTEGSLVQGWGKPPVAAAIVPGILDALREAEQQTRPVIENLQRLMNTPAYSSPCRTFEKFVTDINAAMEATGVSLNEGETSISREFFDALDGETSTLFDGLRHEYMKAAYMLQRKISEEILLAEEITETFSKTLGELVDSGGNKESLSEQVEGVVEAGEISSPEDAILSGIRETIEIKIESLKESIQDFGGQAQDLLKSFAAEQTEIPEEERWEIIERVRVLWPESPPEESGIAEFFQNCFQGEIFAQSRERAQRQMAVYSEKVEKAAFRFKKEVLLYEVCTYEEILTHSVSRLKESPLKTVLAFAALLGDTFSRLEVILKKNNIVVIRPQPHAPFNAKEHEVLVAEKHDGFQKGEIIKLITAGYRLDDQVILRANVIAAR